MLKKYPFAKGNIHENFQKSVLERKNPLDLPQKAFEYALSEIDLSEKNTCLEISHQYSPLPQVMKKHFANNAFISDDAFESLLVYHHHHCDNLSVYQLPFQSKTLEELAKDLQADLVFSYLGIPFKNLRNLLPEILGLTKVNGYFVCVIPDYWYHQEKSEEDARKLLSYSKQNDQDWLFTEALDSVAEENGAQMVGIKELGFSCTMPIIDIAYLSGLNKLYQSIVQNNDAHLEVADLPNEVNLKLSVLIIKKLKKTITLDNLFSS